MLLPPSPKHLGANTTRPFAEWLARTDLVTTLNGYAACKIRQPRNCLQDSESLRDGSTQKLQRPAPAEPTFALAGFLWDNLTQTG